MLLVRYAGYPASMVGVPGEEVSNLSPPTLAAVAFGLAQTGLAFRLHPPPARWTRHARVGAAVSAANRSAMTIFLWHQTALMTVTVAALLTLGAIMDGRKAAMPPRKTLPPRARRLRRTDVRGDKPWSTPGGGARAVHAQALAESPQPELAVVAWLGYPHVRFLGLGLGPDPVSSSFGARVFDAGSGGHSDYLRPGSASLRNLTRIARGRITDVGPR